MGSKPIIEKSNSETMPEDGRISLGKEYAHRRVPLEINIPMDEIDDEPEDEGFMFYTIDKFEADSRGRVTIPAPIRENYSRIFWIVSEAGYEHGSVGEAWEEHRNE